MGGTAADGTALGLNRWGTRAYGCERTRFILHNHNAEWRGGGAVTRLRLGRDTTHYTYVVFAAHKKGDAELG